jgi:integrase
LNHHIYNRPWREGFPCHRQWRPVPFSPLESLDTWLLYNLNSCLLLRQHAPTPHAFHHDHITGLACATAGAGAAQQCCGHRYTNPSPAAAPYA